MDLLVKAQLNVYTKLLSLTDLIAGEYNTTHGYTLSDVKGIFKITGPNSLVYENPGWDTDDYSSPDINGADPDWVKGDIVLPLDNHGNVLTGIYQIEYKVTYDGAGDTDSTFDKSYTHMYIPSAANLIASTVISQSYMIVTDGTNYKISVLGIYYDPTNTLEDSKVLTVRWPAGSKVSDSVTDQASVQLGPNIWTGQYDITLSQLVLYTLPADTGLTVEVSDTILGLKDDVSVQLDECTNTVQNCLIVLTAEYEQAKQYNLPEAQAMKKNLDDIMLYYEMYKMAVATNTSTDYTCNILRDLLTKNGCATTSSSDSSSIEIIPTAQQTGKKEFIVTDIAGQSEFTLPFTLTTNSLVIVEGQLLLNSQVSGFGGTTLTISWTVPAGQTVVVVE